MCCKTCGGLKGGIFRSKPSISYLYLVRKTREGKSAVPLTVAYLQRGIVLMLVPLIGIGLGSDQVSKLSSISNQIEADHLDEHKYDDMIKLKYCLICMDEEEVNNTTPYCYFVLPSHCQINQNGPL